MESIKTMCRTICYFQYSFFIEIIPQFGFTASRIKHLQPNGNHHLNRKKILNKQAFEKKIDFLDIEPLLILTIKACFFRKHVLFGCRCRISSKFRNFRFRWRVGILALSTSAVSRIR